VINGEVEPAARLLAGEIRCNPTASHHAIQRRRLEVKRPYCWLVVLLALFGCGTTESEAAKPKADIPDTEWPGYNGGYDAARFSPLTRTDTKNVAQLKEASFFQIPETLSFQFGPDSGKVLWKYDANTALVAAVTPTAGGVLLSADTLGNFLAFDPADGHVLLKNALGDPIGGGNITYSLGGTQYVAVAGGMKNPIVQTESGPAWVAIFALPDHINH
jgi:glucose dehydrogenase